MRDLRPYHENAVLYRFHFETKFSIEINYVNFLPYEYVISIHANKPLEISEFIEYVSHCCAIATFTQL